MKRRPTIGKHPKYTCYSIGGQTFAIPPSADPGAAPPWKFWHDLLGVLEDLEERILGLEKGNPKWFPSAQMRKKVQELEEDHQEKKGGGR